MVLKRFSLLAKVIDNNKKENLAPLLAPVKAKTPDKQGFFLVIGGRDGIRTRDPARDRHVSKRSRTTRPILIVTLSSKFFISIYIFRLPLKSSDPSLGSAR